MSWAAAAGSGSKPSPDNAWPLGTACTLSLSGGRVVSGSVVAASANVLALQQPAGDRALTLVNLASVEKVTERTPPPAGFQAEKLPELDAARSGKRLEDALRDAAAAAARIGVGVSQEAQALFDALSKTYPCFWRDKSIVVMEDVVVSEPYTDCTGGSTAANERVRMVLSALQPRAAGK